LLGRAGAAQGALKIVSKLVAYGCCLLAIAVGAGAQEGEDAPEVIIRVPAAGNIPIMVLAPAKAEATAVPRTAGVKARWETAGRSKPQVHECSGSVADVIDVLVVDRGTGNDHLGALAYSLPFASSGTRVVIFYDRVAFETTKPNPTLPGFAIAHEIGHVLRGTDTHNLSGVMRDHRDERDYAQMAAHVLRFTADDADSMRRHVARKARSCAATALTGPAAKEPPAEE
jgi:hypothetical protein